MDTIHVSAEQLRRQLADLLNRVGYGKERVIVERYGAPVAVLLPYKTYQNLPEVASKSEEPNPPANELAPFEQAPALAQEIETARKEAGLTYETLAERLQTERLKTLREKYPDFAARYDTTQSA